MNMKEKETQNAAELPCEETVRPNVNKENASPNAENKNSAAVSWVRGIFYTIISALLLSVAAYSLIAPNNFTIGGIGGIAILVKIASHGKVPQSLLIFCLNAPLVALSFFFVKRRFAILSTLNIVMQTVWLVLIEKLIPDFIIIFPGGETSKIFAAVAAGICIGVAIVLAFKVGGSTGGADILAVIIQKKIAAGSIAWMLFTINCVVIGASLFVFETPYTDVEKTKIDFGAWLLPVVLSAFESYIESRTNEAMTNGFNSAIEYRIITDKPDVMATALMKELSRGVTAQPAKGMYTQETHTMLICVVSKRQVATVRKIMKQIDPNSFAVMSKVSQVFGLGFYYQEI